MPKSNGKKASKSNGKGKGKGKEPARAQPVCDHTDGVPCAEPCPDCGKHLTRAVTTVDIEWMTDVLDKLYQDPELLWSLMNRQKPLSLPQSDENDEFYTEHRFRAMAKKFTKMAAEAGISNDADIRNMFDGYVSGRYQWSTLKNIAVELIDKALVDLDVQTTNLRRVMGLVEAKIAERRRAERENEIISRHIIPRVYPADEVKALQTRMEMITEPNPEITSISALEYQLDESKMLLNMAKASRATLLEKKAKFEAMDPVAMGHNATPATGRERLEKADMDWRETMELVGSMVPDEMGCLVAKVAKAEAAEKKAAAAAGKGVAGPSKAGGAGKEAAGKKEEGASKVEDVVGEEEDAGTKDEGAGQDKPKGKSKKSKKSKGKGKGKGKFKTTF
ncbi:hypothetical protein QBC47DRAFT_398023 [Echria macrotheca]|uniref:Uncharacterized protein n=1 Tax=Echria macrotheca TaxID=438768 RepID=A0AAJ0FEW4_9PEZI|nr:hypothetical protein QBC47DRAFT_398023 [Echria macrotheca]